MVGRLLVIVVAGLMGISAWAQGPASRPIAVPDSIRTELKLGAFYQQYVDAGGIAIVGSQKVSPYALMEARHLVEQMLASRPDVHREMARIKSRVVVMALNEYTVDVPEHANLKPPDYWNKRARGLGASRQMPLTSCGEENLLELKGDPYRGENILIHEFGHSVHSLGMNAVDRTFDGRLKKTFDAAIAKGLWKGTYAATNHGEYWAEGVQSWFDCNASKNFIHNGVRTREALKEYDPELCRLLEEAFGDRPWRYELPQKRKEAGHLRGMEWDKLPVFKWPAELLEGKKNPDKK